MNQVMLVSYIVVSVDWFSDSWRYKDAGSTYATHSGVNLSTIYCASGEAKYLSCEEDHYGIVRYG